MIKLRSVITAWLFAIFLFTGNADAWWQSIQQVAISSGVTFSLAYIDNRIDTGTTQTITYNAGGNPSIGAADPNRVVVVGMGRRSDTAAINSVLINGSNATHVTGAFVKSGGVMVTDIWYLGVATGTTATIVVDWGGSVFSDSGIAIWRVVTGTPTPTTASTGVSASGITTITSYTVPSGGKSMNVFIARDVPLLTGVDWTVAVEDFDVPNLTFGQRAWSGATVSAAGSAAPTIACTTTPCDQENAASAAAWGP